MLSQSLHMLRIAAYSQDCAMNFRIQSFYTAIHDFREPGYITYIGYRNACFLNSLHGAAGRNNFYTVVTQEFCQLYNAGFITNA